MMTHEEFTDRVFRWANRIGVADRISSIEIKRLIHEGRIACCTSKGRLFFDPSVLYWSEKEIDHVIVHEVLHLIVPNHGKLFKCLLKAYLSKGLEG